MKILMVNKFLYPKGGAETYTLSLGKILEEHGHQVQYFGLNNPKNTVGNDMNALVKDMDFSTGVMHNLNAPFRIIYNFQARKQIRKVLDDFKPDIVHLNNIEYHLTPSIIVEVNSWRKKNNQNCKIIYTAHDYQLVCPSHGLFDVNIKPCELCLDGRYIHCLQTKCLKNSYTKSLLGTIDSYYWHKSKAYSYVDTYICCSDFLKQRLDTLPIFKSKTVTLHNFKDITPLEDIKKKDYILEFGRLCKDKGTETFIEAAKHMPDYKFVLIGAGPSATLVEGISNIEYLGFKNGDELYRYIAEAKLSICPSECYDNCPFSVIESISLGTPVIGSRMGGIPELITEGYNGELFEAGNVQDLELKIRKILQSEEVLKQYTDHCLQTEFETSNSYYEKLMKIYQKESNRVK